MAGESRPPIKKPVAAAADVVPLICAADAYRLRRATINALWAAMTLEQQQKLTLNLQPDVFAGELHDTTVRDLDALRLYWLGLRTDSQTMERDWWCGRLKNGPATESVTAGNDDADAVEQVELEKCIALPPEEWSDDKRRDIVDNLASLYDEGLRQIAERVLRGRELYVKLWTMDQNKVDTLGKLIELSAMVLMPVTTDGRGARRGHLLFVHDDEHPWVSGLQATTDRPAYNAFYRFSKTMKNVLCDDYRSIENGGIRSLHPYMFNSLGALRSTGDHPAALLLGCRSGVQYPVRGPDGLTIAMVALYFPVYNFFARYCETDGNALLSPKVKEAWNVAVGGDGGVGAAAKVAENAWYECWAACGPGAEDTTCELRGSCLARVLLEPYRNPGGPGMAAVSHLAAVTSWPGGLKELVKNRLPDVLEQKEHEDHLAAIAEKDFNEDRLIALGDWVVGLRVQIAAGKAPGAPRPAKVVESLKADRGPWVEAVRTALKAEPLINALSSTKLAQLESYLIDDLWTIMSRAALQFQSETTKYPKCTIRLFKGRVVVKFQLVHWHFKGRVQPDMKTFDALEITSQQDRSGKGELVTGILAPERAPAHAAALNVLGRHVPKTAEPAAGV